MTNLNSHGSYKTTQKAAMEAFDKLRPELREALRNAEQNWAPQPFLTQYRRGLGVEMLALLIRHADQKDRAAAERKLEAGTYANPEPKVRIKVGRG